MSLYSPRRDLLACIGVMSLFAATFTAIWVALP